MPSSQKPNLGLYSGWSTGETGWDTPTGMNENLSRLDATVMLAVIDKDLSTPPGSPTAGDRYIVKATGTGAWSGHDGDIALYEGGSWVFFDPKEGWIAWANDEDKLYIYSGSAWVEFVQGTGGGSAPTAAYIWLGAADFYGDVGFYTSRGSGTSVNIVITLLGTADRNAVAHFVVPKNYSSLTSIKAYYMNNSTSTANFVLQPGFDVQNDGIDGTQAPTMATKSIITPPGVVDEVDIVTLNNPSVSLAAGKVVRLILQRPAAADSDDANTNTMWLLGVLIEVALA